MQTKRIAIVVPEYRSEKSGGGVSAVADFLIEAFETEQSWATDIISLRMWRGAEQSRRFLAPTSWLRGPIVTRRLHIGRAVFEVGSDWAELEFMRFWPRRILDSLLADYDLAVVVSGTPGAIYALRKSKVPVVSQIATFVEVEREALLARSKGGKHWYISLMTFVSSWLDRQGLRVASKVLVENEWMLRGVKQLGVNDVELCAPGVDTDRFRPSDKPATGGYFLMVGRLDDPRKRVHLLLEAYALARAKYELHLGLILAGRFAPVEEDLALIRTLGIEEYVEILSPVSSADLVDLYQNSDAFVLSSAEEGLGVVLIEAMACGKAVISTNTEGAKYVIGDAKVGEMIDNGPESVLRLAEALGKWGNDPDLCSRAGELGRKRAVENFSLATSGKRFRSAVREVLERDSA